MKPNPFKQRDPSKLRAITFMLHGDAGTGKTFFALASKKWTGKPVAYIGNDDSSDAFLDHPEIGGYHPLETSSLETLEEGIQYMEAGGWNEYGAIVLDTTTEVYRLIQKQYETSKRWDKFKKQWVACDAFIPKNAWRTIKDTHLGFLRRLRRLPIHTFLIAEEKIVFKTVLGSDGKEELAEAGTREDSDKKDRYICDVRLRFFKNEQGKRCAEIFKDRYAHITGFSDEPPNNVLVAPHAGLWIKGAAMAPAAESNEDNRTMLELIASNLIAAVRKKKGKDEVDKWAKDRVNKSDFTKLPKDLQEKVTQAAKEQAEVA